MESFEECKNKLLRETGLADYGLPEWFYKKVAETYADQFKRHLVDVSEEEIKEKAWLRLNEYAEHSAELTWIEAINWYKTKILIS